MNDRTIMGHDAYVRHCHRDVQATEIIHRLVSSSNAMPILSAPGKSHRPLPDVEKVILQHRQEISYLHLIYPGPPRSMRPMEPEDAGTVISAAGRGASRNSNCRSRCAYAVLEPSDDADVSETASHIRESLNVDECWPSPLRFRFRICSLVYSRPLRAQFSRSSGSCAMRRVCGSLS